MAFVQKSTVGTFSGLTATATLNGVTNLNSLICTVSHLDNGQTGPSFTISDGAGYNQDVNSAVLGYSNTIIASRYAVAGGNYTVTVTALSGSAGNSYGSIQLSEFSNLVTNGFDASATAGTYSTALTCGPTGTLAQNTELLIAALFVSQNNGSGGPITTPPTGGPGSFVNLASINPSSNLCADFDYQLNTGTNAAVSVNYGSLPNPSVWGIAVATYKESGGAMQSADLYAGMDPMDWLPKDNPPPQAMRGYIAAQYPVPAQVFQPFTYHQYLPRKRIILLP